MSSGAAQHRHEELLCIRASATALLTVISKNGANQAVIDKINASRKLSIAV